MKKHIQVITLSLATILSSTAFAEDIKVSGKVFFDYSAINTSTPTTNTDKRGGTISRTYLTLKKKVDDTWSTKVTFDSALNSGHTGKDSEVFLKTAQLTGSFSEEVHLKLGLIATPWLGYEDKLGKHRHVSKSFVDTHKMDSSADAGVGIFGQLMDGLLVYDVVSINGGGYGNVTTSEKTDINLRLGVRPMQGLTIDLGYRHGYKGTFDAANTENETTLTQFLMTYGATMGDLSYRVALNNINNKIVDQLPNGAATVTEKGVAIWAWARRGDFGGYFRSESLDNGISGDATEKRMLLSADYFVSKGVVVSLVSDSSTDIGGAAGNDKSTLGLFTQFKF